MARINRLAAATALAAAFSMVAVPAAAADLPRPHGPASAKAWDEGANTAEHSRWHRRYHRGGIDGGDVLAGVLILGGIAAIASAAENNDRGRDYPPPPPPPSGRYDYRPAYRDAGPRGSATGLDHAADICADAIERTIDPVGSVDSVRRGPSGWDVDGTLRNGRPFTCSIGNDGQITDIQTDNSYSGAAYREGGDPDRSYGDDDPNDDRPVWHGDQSSIDGQYDDETYARLREQQGEGVGG